MRLITPIFVSAALIVAMIAGPSGAVPLPSNGAAGNPNVQQVAVHCGPHAHYVRGHRDHNGHYIKGVCVRDRHH